MSTSLRDTFTPPVAAAGPPAAGPASAPVASPAKSFNILDLKQYFHIIVRRIWLVALCFVIALAVTVVKLTRQVPVFSSTTSLLFTKGIPIPARLKQEQTETLGEFIDTQVTILRGNLIISRARERVNRPAAEIAQKLVGISVDMGWKTSFLYIRVTSLDAVFAADFANAMADAYLDFRAEERMDNSQSTAVILAQQASRMREELKKADERILSFEKENNVVAIGEIGNMAAGILAGLAGEAAALRTARMRLEFQQPMLTGQSDEIILSVLGLPSATAGAIAQPSISGLNSETNGSLVSSRGLEGMMDRGTLSGGGWQALKRQRAFLENKLAELRTQLRDEHPSIQQTLREIKEIDFQSQLELKFALSEYYNNLDALKIQEQVAKRTADEWEDEAIAASRRAREYQTLQKDVTRLSSLYDLLFNRLKDVDVALGVEPESVKIYERAVPSGAPQAPRQLQSLFLAALMGLGVGIGLVFGLEFIDDSIRYPEEVSKFFNLTFLGVIPAANWDPDDLRTHVLANIDQKSGLTEAYRNLRSALLFSSNAESAKFMAITSAVPKEGKTTTSLNMAVSLAQAGFRVLLVDADMRRGELHKFFGLEGGRGLSDVLIGQVKPESVIQRSGIPNLDLVATGPFPPNPAELVLRSELHSFVDYAKRTYDRIIMDCPPVMAVSEASILCSLADSVILVVWAGQTSRKLCQLALSIIRQRGANVIGCVLNNLEFGRVGYYYYSTYYGYYDYDYRYERGKKPAKT